MSRQRLVFLGDSITQYASMPNGWINLLSERFVREYDFINRGFSGYNTRWMLGMASKTIIVYYIYPTYLLLRMNLTPLMCVNDHHNIDKMTRVVDTNIRKVLRIK